jgi:uncharacterized protein
MLWLDVENPPQVQYLLPVAHAARQLGAQVLVTARDYGETFDLLDSRDEPYHGVGAAYGSPRRAKVRGVFRRVRSLVRTVRSERPAALVCASRAAVVAARLMKVPSYVILDYEFVDARIFRLGGSTILYPDVIELEALRRRGLSQRHLVPFHGLKEDLTFANLSLETIEAADIGQRPGDAPRVLFRPAAEESHYYRPESRVLALRTLEHLAGQDVQVVFSPRYERQTRDIEGLGWRIPPLVLRRPLPFVPLLKSVDAVVCSGGTMFREAAYLGIPAYSIFQGQLGAVDLHLEAIGRARIIRSSVELDLIRLERRRAPLSPMRSNAGLAEDIARRALGIPADVPAASRAQTG